MAYTVFPNEEQIATFKTKLTDEETWLLEKLKDVFNTPGYENRNFEIHVKPNLFLGKPDFIILEPEYSGWIIQVNSENSPILEQLIKEVEQYKSELITDVGISSQGDKFGLIIRTAVFQPNNDSQTESYPHTKILFKNDFNISNDNATTDLSSYFGPVLKKNLRLAQTEYENVSAYLAPGSSRPHTPVLDFSGEAKYKTLCQSKAGKQKIKGVAGSGKTTVLAKRAVACSDRMVNGEILITYFNITMGNYIREKVLAEGRGRTLNEMGIQIQNFHSLYRWPNFQRGIKRSGIQYGAIFIDEGQDYQRDWFDALITDYLIGSDISGENEFVIFADEKQNIYERFTDLEADEYGRQKALPVTPIPGAWNVLNKVYRTTNTEISSLLTAFSTDVLKDTEIETNSEPNSSKSEVKNSIFFTDMTNLNVDKHTQIEYIGNKILEYVNRLLDVEHISLGDIAIISSSKHYLKQIEYSLRISQCELGYNHGYHKGYTKGYHEGYRSGYDEIYYEDPSNDCWSNFDNSYSQAYYQCYEQGYNFGYERGRIWGYNWGYDQMCSQNRYEQDYYQNYDQGYTQGYNYGTINNEHSRIHFPTITTFKPWDGIETFSNSDNQDSRIDRPYKVKFFRDNDLIKISTIHSFKGWEIPYVILVIPPSSNGEASNDFLTYTGLSRPKKGMLVLNLNPKYTDFFESQHLKVL